MLNYYKAEEGKVWKHKATGTILSSELYLGIQDSIDNYVQVDEPIEEGREYEVSTEENIEP